MDRIKFLKLKIVMKRTALFLTFLTITSLSFGQFNPMKKFDFSLLENRTLWIPQYSLSDKTIESLLKKDQMEKYDLLTKSATSMNALWDKVMKRSSYSATDYVMKEYDFRGFMNEKNPDAIALFFIRVTKDGVSNNFAQIMSAYPKKRVIARSIINGLDITDENDLTLIINMLNQGLNAGVELEEEGNKSFKAIRNKYKETFVAFYETINEKTFLVPEYDASEKKADKKNAELKEAMKSWNISKVKMVSENEISQERKANSTTSFYWKNVPYYTGGFPPVYNLNYIINTESDEVVFYFMGKKALKPANMEEAQKKMQKRYLKFKEDLDK